MKRMMLFAVVTFSFFFFSCSELIEENSIVSPQISSKTSVSSRSINYPTHTTFSSIPLKDWSTSSFSKGIRLTAGASMQEYDHVFALLDYGERQSSVLVCLQKIDDIHYMPVSGDGVKDVLLYGIYSAAADNGVYPFSYLSTFQNLAITDWQDGGGSVKVALENWNDSSRNLFIELTTEKEKALIFIGDPGTQEFEVPTFGLSEVVDVRAFATLKTLDLPLDAN